TGGLAEGDAALAGRSLAYLGDGANNMAHSYLLGGATAGMDVRIAAPEGHRPAAQVIARAEEIAASTGGAVSVTADPREAVAGTTAVLTDTWVSMGQEGEDGRGEETFAPYQVTQELMDLSGGLFLHCLPAYRGKEVAAEVIDGPASVVWDEAENRLHAQKALLTSLLDHPGLSTAGRRGSGDERFAPRPRPDQDLAPAADRPAAHAPGGLLPVAARAAADRGGHRGHPGHALAGPGRAAGGEGPRLGREPRLPAA